MTAGRLTGVKKHVYATRLSAIATPIARMTPRSASHVSDDHP
ncbi:MAG: hypothetical protein ACRYGM_07965 [Janthinobacterium lividum]